MGIKALIRKEMLDGQRNYRFLILFAAVVFFAILDPVMNKLILPELFKSQFPNITEEVMRGMLATTQAANIRGYLGNVFQLGILIIAFTLSGITAQEISEKTLIFPVCTGKRYGGMLLAKILVFGGYLLLVSILSTLICYFYAGALFGFSLPSPLPAIRAGMLQGSYLFFVVALLMLIGSLVRKPVPTGLLTLIPAYGIRVVGNLSDLHRYLPSGLLVEAEMLSVAPSPYLAGSLVSTAALVVVCLCLTVIRLTKLELTRGAS